MNIENEPEQREVQTRTGHEPTHQPRDALPIVSMPLYVFIIIPHVGRRVAVLRSSRRAVSATSSRANATAIQPA